MTTPILSDFGIALVRALPTRSFTENFVVLFRPVSYDLWLYAVCAAVFISIVFVVTEHGHGPRFARVLKMDDAASVTMTHEPMAEKWKSARSSGNGYFTSTAVRREYLPDAGIPAVSSLFGGQAPKAITIKGAVLRLAWGFFTCIFVASYTANLAAMQGDDRLALTGASLEDDRRKDLNVCARTNTAYFDVLQTKAFPDFTYKGLEANNFGAVWENLKKGDCDVYADTFAHAEMIAFDKKYCSKIYVKHDSTLKYGPLDYAFGAKDPRVADALSYWIGDIRECSIHDASSDCYLGANMDSIYRIHVTNDCDAGFAETEQINPEKVFLPFLIVGAVGLTCLFLHLWPFPWPLPAAVAAKYGCTNSHFKATVRWKDCFFRKADVDPQYPAPPLDDDPSLGYRQACGRRRRHGYRERHRGREKDPQEMVCMTRETKEERLRRLKNGETISLLGKCTQGMQCMCALCVANDVIADLDTELYTPKTFRDPDAKALATRRSALDDPGDERKQLTIQMALEAHYLAHNASNWKLLRLLLEKRSKVNTCPHSHRHSFENDATVMNDINSREQANREAVISGYNTEIKNFLTQALLEEIYASYVSDK